MKRIGYLYEKIFTHDNLSLAIDRACLNKENRKVVRKVLDNKEAVIKFLQDNPTYVKIHEATPRFDTSSHKTRDIVTPDFTYLIKQHAIIQIIYPIYAKSFYPYSFGAIKGKGIHRASKHLRSLIKNNYRDTRYAIKIDVKKFYDNIDNKILINQLERKIKDKKVIGLLNDIIGGKEKGIPIGNYTSQIFANIYLTPLDHFIKEKLKLKCLDRQMDDILFMAANKRKLVSAYVEIVKYIKENLKCDVHDERVQIVDLHKRGDGDYQNPKTLKGKAFIDFCAYKHYVGGIVTIRKRIFNRLRHTIFTLLKHFCLKFARRFMSYWGYVLRSNSHNFLAKYMPLVNMANIRQIISNATKMKLKGASV